MYQKLLVGVIGVSVVVLSVVLYHREFITLSPTENRVIITDTSEAEVLETYFSERVDIYIAEHALEASVARTEKDRQQGLSGTPFLPEGVVKLFVFDSSDRWGIWMKDMQYPIDILWIDSSGVVVDIEQAASPASYPRVFTPTDSARYIIETNAGLVADKSIQVGDQVRLPAEL